jgi:hypothetical protein
VLATNRKEETWGQKTLSKAVTAEADKLRAFLQRNQKRGQLRSGVINFDSARQLEEIKAYDFRARFFEDDGISPFSR